MEIILFSGFWTNYKAEMNSTLATATVIVPEVLLLVVAMVAIAGVAVLVVVTVGAEVALVAV